MKILKLAAIAAVAITGLGLPAAPAFAQHHRYGHHSWHRSHHTRTVCRWVGHGHRRHRVCRTVRW